MQSTEKSPKLKIVKTAEAKDIEPDASQLFFRSTWNVWIHRNASTDWKLTGYDKIFSIQNVADFWNFMNTFSILNYMDYQFVIMKNNIAPIWEDAENKNGGSAVIRMKLTDKNLLNAWEDMCILTFNEQICPDANDINGISFNMKKDLTVVKIWNKNVSNDISKKIANSLINKYRLYSISYTKNRANS